MVSVDVYMCRSVWRNIFSCGYILEKLSRLFFVCVTKLVDWAIAAGNRKQAIKKRRGTFFIFLELLN
jgi:hypothetical protein